MKKQKRDRTSTLFNRGFMAGINGRSREECPVETVELRSHWMSGWREGREAHRRYADFARSYPESEYRTEVGPRLNALLEEMAQAEYSLAREAELAGDMQDAEARMRYLLRYYPLSSVARQASDWLADSVPGEADAASPGTAW